MNPIFGNLPTQNSSNTENTHQQGITTGFLGDYNKKLEEATEKSSQDLIETGFEYTRDKIESGEFENPGPADHENETSNDAVNKQKLQDLINPLPSIGNTDFELPAFKPGGSNDPSNGGDGSMGGNGIFQSFASSFMQGLNPAFNALPGINGGDGSNESIFDKIFSLKGIALIAALAYFLKQIR